MSNAFGLGSLDTAVPISRAYELEQMAGKKDINSLLPSDTRFRFIKRVIRRIMYTITRDQEEFNNEVFKAVQEVKKIKYYCWFYRTSHRNFKIRNELRGKGKRIGYDKTTDWKAKKG